MTSLFEILSRRPAVIHVLPSRAPVREAVRVMARHHIGAVLITRAKTLVGIFTERDLLRRVVAADVDLDLPIELVMTANPVTVRPNDTRASAIERMHQLNCRHLPVVVDGLPVDMVSIRDLVFDEIQERAYEISELNRYIASSW
jgi:CBS domain-containing protein